MTDLDRRDVLKLMGVGVVSLGAAGTLLPSASAESTPRVEPTPPLPRPEPTVEKETAEAPWWLVAPFVPDSQVAGARLLSMAPVHEGVLTLELEGRNRKRFQVHICKRDDALSMPPPARSRHYDFLLANGGKGDRQTSRAEGEVMIELARAAWQNETTRAALPLATMRQRWADLQVPC